MNKKIKYRITHDKKGAQAGERDEETGKTASARTKEQH